MLEGEAVLNKVKDLEERPEFKQETPAIIAGVFVLWARQEPNTRGNQREHDTFISQAVRKAVQSTKTRSRSWPNSSRFGRTFPRRFATH